MKVTDFAHYVNKLIEERKPFAVATVVKIEGSSLGKPGFKSIIDANGNIIYGTLGGVCPESAISYYAVEAIKSNQPKLIKVFLEETEKSLKSSLKSTSEDEVHVETFCGGVMHIYIEPYVPPRRLIIIGQGGKDDVEDNLIKLGKILDFEVIVIDHKPILTEEPDMLITDLNFELEKFNFQSNDAVIVLTKGDRDILVLTTLLNKNVPFIGLVASSKRAEHNINILKEKGFTDEQLSRLHTPVGIDIGAITPAEIALSILAEIISLRSGKHYPHKK
jgi:Xanthine and CO dehydrogenases maturation factor, XdhC/CoxF family